MNKLHTSPHYSRVRALPHSPGPSTTKWPRNSACVQQKDVQNWHQRTRLNPRRYHRGRGSGRPQALPSTTTETLITVEQISKSHDGIKILFQDLSFTIARGGRLAVIGANGSGKTSLLKLLSGADWPDEGEVKVRKGTQIGFLTQEADLPEGVNALEAVVQADSPIASAVREYNRLLSLGPAADAREMELALDKMNAFGAWELEEKAKAVLQQVGITSPSMKVEEMSGGQRRKVTVAAALLGNPDVLILDEPTNHMDVQFIQWMESTITAASMTLVLVTHDRFFMECTCTEILELDGGRGYLHPIGGPGSYATFQARREERRKAQVAAVQDARVVLRKEAEWMSRQPQARATKSRARIASFYELTAKAKALPKPDLRVSFGDVSMARQGNMVLEMKNCTKTWNGAPFISDFTYEFSRGERIGVVGPNGSGKSTLLDIIAGTQALDGGTRTVGDTTVIGYFAQHVPDFNPKLRIIDYINGIADNSSTASIMADIDWGMKPDRMLNLLGFPFEQQRQLVSSLSGGERRRLYLASILAQNPNFLILDEPTNDLDLSTIETLEGMLDGYGGVVLVVSHDKAFMDRATDRMFVLEGDGVVRLFDGDYSDYVEYIEERQRERRAREAEAERQARAREAAARAAAPAANGGASPAAAEQKVLRLGFREKQELQKLEKEVDRLTSQKEELEADIGRVAQEGDFTKVATLTEQLQRVAAELDTKTDKWLELAERAEVAGTV